MSRGEAEQLLTSAKELRPDLYPLFLMALRAGLRKGRVDLSRELRSCLLELRDTRLLAAMMAGKTGIADDLSFHSKAGTVLDPNHLVHYHFQPCLEHAGLRRFRFHDLRHTFGSLLIQDGASLAYVKEQMGHSSIQITVDTYGHLIPGADINWIDGLDRRTSQQQNATPAQPVAAQAESESLEVVEEDGERGRNRTYNLLIKSSLRMRNQQFSSFWLCLVSLVFVRLSQQDVTAKLNGSKPPLGTNLGTKFRCQILGAAREKSRLSSGWRTRSRGGDGGRLLGKGLSLLGSRDRAHQLHARVRPESGSLTSGTVSSSASGPRDSQTDRVSVRNLGQHVICRTVRQTSGARRPGRTQTRTYPYRTDNSLGCRPVRHCTASYCNFAYSALACFRMGMSGSASFQSVRKSL
jgi:Phage integrase family